MYLHATNTKNGYLHNVFLNGKLLNGCIEADEISGWARCVLMEAVSSEEDSLRPSRLIMDETTGRPSEYVCEGEVRIVKL